jgi:alpha-glucosidase
VRGGAIVPLGRIVQDTNEDSFQPLTLLVSLDAHGQAQGKLYEDAGDGYGYRNGEYRLTTYRAERQGDTVKVGIAGREGRWPAAARPVVVQLVTDAGVVTARGTDGNVILRLPHAH